MSRWLMSTCLKKKAYQTKAEAEGSLAWEQRHRGVGRLKVYRCPLCGHYHIAHVRWKGA
jgi:hypothetical protein